MKYPVLTLLAIVALTGSAAFAQPTTTNGIPVLAGTALAFDGVDDYASTTNNVPLANTTFSIELYAQSFRSNADQYFLFQGAAAANLGLHMGLRPNNVFTFGFWGNDLDTPQPYIDAGWHHWACTFNATTKDRRVYRDGVLVANGVAAANYQGSGVLELGRLSAVGSFFRGNLDEVRVWNRELNASEIATNRLRRLATNESGLLAYWRCDERTGRTVADVTGHGYPLQLVNGPDWIASTAFPPWTPSGDWRKLKLLWPLGLDGTVSPIYSNGPIYFSSGRYVGLSSLADLNAGIWRDYKGNVADYHNGLDIGHLSYRIQNNNGLKVYAAAGGVLAAFRDGHEDHNGGADINAATAQGRRIYLVSRWRLNEGTGTNVVDSSTNGVHGAITGTGWAWTNDPVHGAILRLNGNAHIFIPNGLYDFGTANFTIGAWIKTTQLGAPILFKGNGDTTWTLAEKQLYLSGTETFNDDPDGAVTMVGHSAGYATGSTVVNDGQWHHVAFSYNRVSSAATVYVDGQPSAMTRNGFGANPDNSGDRVRIGFAGGGEAKSNLVGWIDDVVIYHGALDQAAVQSIMSGNTEAPLSANGSAFDQWAKYQPGNVAGIFDGSGNTVYLLHTNGFVTQYAHLKKGLNVTNHYRLGDWVPAGTLVGTAGSSGASGGPHLHFGVLVGPENQALYPQLFDPVGRTNTGLVRFARAGSYPWGVFLEPFFEEPGTAETMWAPGQAIPPYQPWVNDLRDIYDMAISTAPIWSVNPADNVTTAPLYSDIYVAAYTVGGVGETKFEIVNPAGATNQLVALGGDVPAARVDLPGAWWIYSYRRASAGNAWQRRSENRLEVLPSLARQTFLASPTSNTCGTIIEAPAGSGVGATLIPAQLFVGDDAGNRQMKSIITFDTGPMPEVPILYGELRLRIRGVEGINPFEKSYGWAGRMFVDAKISSFGSSTALEPQDFQDLDVGFVARAATLSKVRAAGDVAVAVLNSNALALINRAGTTQFRIYCELNNNTNDTSDALQFFNDAQIQPELVLYHNGPATLEPDAAALVEATLSGTYNPQGLPTTAWFEWGTSTNYANATGPQSLGNGNSVVSLHQAITRLRPGTSYHYRLVVSNAFVVVRGADQAWSTPVPGAGAALRFDGTNDYVAMDGIELRNRSFTIECWARSARAGVDRFFLSQGPPYVNNNALIIGFRGNDTFTMSFWGNDLDTPAAYPDTNWHHWACTLDFPSGARRIYRDGVLIANDTAGPYQGAGTFYVGAFPRLNNYFQGEIDELRIWDSARSTNQIFSNMSRQLTGGEAGLLALYRFDEAVGKTVFDASGRGLSGDLVNGPLWAPSFANVASAWIETVTRTNNEARLRFLAGSNLTYHVYGSANLASWSDLGVAAQTSAGVFGLTNAMGLPYRFYRVQWP